MNRGELLWRRMAYLIPAHLQCWPQPSRNALGLSAPPTTGQSNFGRVYFLWKVREVRERGVGGWQAGKGRGELYRFRLVVIRSTWSEMLILKPTLWKGRGSEQIRQSRDETGAQRHRGRSGIETRCTSPRPAVLWGLISMPQKVTAGNLLNTTAICLPCSKGTNEKVYKLKSTWNFKDNTF